MVNRVLTWYARRRRWYSGVTAETADDKARQPEELLTQKRIPTGFELESAATDYESAMWKAIRTDAFGQMPKAGATAVWVSSIVVAGSRTIRSTLKKPIKCTHRAPEGRLSPSGGDKPVYSQESEPRRLLSCMRLRQSICSQETLRRESQPKIRASVYESKRLLCRHCDVIIAAANCDRNEKRSMPKLLPDCPNNQRPKSSLPLGLAGGAKPPKKLV